MTIFRCRNDYLRSAEMTIYEVPKSLGADLTWCRNDFFRSAEITWGRFDLLPYITLLLY